MKNLKLLFILKRREDYSTNLENFQKPAVASGMFNSASFVADKMRRNGFDTKVIIVTDNNDIDREVTLYKPTHVFIEGYWVVPEKFDVLMPLHPSVKWIVRCHSELPFLAQEGIAIDWTFEYLKRNIQVSSNSPRFHRELREMTSTVPFAQFSTPLLPNYYPTQDFTTREIKLDGFIDIGCFGAFRPMKNQMAQAQVAIQFAEKLGKKLRFHVNAGRVEMYGANALKNMKALFNNRPDHELVEHGWTSHEEFLELLKTIDISMQVSFTETFNIVSADALSVGTPVVGSSEIPYIYPVYADPTSSEDMLDKLEFVWNHRKVLIKESKKRLEVYDEASNLLWLAFLYESPFGKFQQARLEKQLLAPERWTWPVYLNWLLFKNYIW